MYVREFKEPYRSILISLGAKEDGKIFFRSGYPCIYSSKVRSGFYVHRAVMARKLGVESLPRTTFVHHINEDRTDFRPENLDTCTHGEHNALHKRFGKDNHFYGKTHDDKARKTISQFAKARKDLVHDEKGRFAACTQ